LTVAKKEGVRSGIVSGELCAAHDFGVLIYAKGVTIVSTERAQITHTAVVEQKRVSDPVRFVSAANDQTVFIDGDSITILSTQGAQTSKPPASIDKGLSHARRACFGVPDNRAAAVNRVRRAVSASQRAEIKEIPMTKDKCMGLAITSDSRVTDNLTLVIEAARYTARAAQGSDSFGRSGVEQGGYVSVKHRSSRDLALCIDRPSLADGSTQYGPDILQNGPTLSEPGNKGVESGVARGGRSANHLSPVINAQ